MTQPTPTVESTSAIAPPVSQAPTVRTAAAPKTSREPLPGGLQRRAAAIRHALIGTAMTQAFLTSILALGWVQKSCRTVALRQWQRRSSASTAPLEPWPSWFLAPGTQSQPRWKGLFHRFRETGSTVRAGLQALLCLGVATLPGCLLWAFAWYDGWQNSFAKGYEHAFVGPSLFAVGTLLFVIAMLYVPMAQARLGATGSWRGFFDVRTVWTLVKQRWMASFGLALVCTGLNVPVSLLKTFPAVQAQAVENQIRAARNAGKPIPPDLVHPADLTPSEQLRYLQRYYLMSGLYVFPAFVLIHFLAARIYASALVEALRRRRISSEALTPWEATQLKALDLWPEPISDLAPAVSQPRWSLARRWLPRFAAVATGVVWLTFMGQIVVAEFFKATAWGRGWWNQPLLQLPWFNYVPAALESAAGAKLDSTVTPRHDPHTSPGRQN